MDDGSDTPVLPNGVGDNTQHTRTTSSDMIGFIRRLADRDVLRIDPFEARRNLSDIDFAEFRELSEEAQQSYRADTDALILERRSARQVLYRHVDEAVSRSDMFNDFRSSLLDAVFDQTRGSTDLSSIVSDAQGLRARIDQLASEFTISRHREAGAAIAGRSPSALSGPTNNFEHRAPYRPMESDARAIPVKQTPQSPPTPPASQNQITNLERAKLMRDLGIPFDVKTLTPTELVEYYGGTISADGTTITGLKLTEEQYLEAVEAGIWRAIFSAWDEATNDKKAVDESRDNAILEEAASQRGEARPGEPIQSSLELRQFMLAIAPATLIAEIGVHPKVEHKHPQDFERAFSIERNESGALVISVLSVGNPGSSSVQYDPDRVVAVGHVHQILPPGGREADPELQVPGSTKVFRAGTGTFPHEGPNEWLAVFEAGVPNFIIGHGSAIAERDGQRIAGYTNVPAIIEVGRVGTAGNRYQVRNLQLDGSASPFLPPASSDNGKPNAIRWVEDLKELEAELASRTEQAEDE